MVELSGKNRALNEFSVERVGEKVENNLVILHGYGAGLGFFYRNFEALSRAKGWQLYALDLLGMGRSTRPSFRIKAKDRQDATKEAEDWFIDSLEEWRIRQKIDRFTLMGHSLGGYMAVAYALKYPGHLNKLILASPVGIPEDPYAMSADLPEPEESTLANEFAQDQTIDSTVDSNSVSASDKASNPTGQKPSDGTNTPPRRPLSKWLTYLWDANISPFSVIRWSGPLGPRLTSGWTSRRFAHLPEDEAQALHDYSYSLFRMRGSGEYALAYILAPGAFARSPLIRRIHRVGRQPLPAGIDAQPSSSILRNELPSSSSQTTRTTPSTSSSTSKLSLAERRENGIPVVLLYGDHDWMDVNGGYAAKERIESERTRILQSATPEERAADNGSATVHVVDRSGHHLYLENPDQFNKIILAEMEDVRRREAKISSL